MRKLVTLSGIGIVVIIVVLYFTFNTKSNQVNDLIALDSVNRITYVDGSNGDTSEISDEKEKQQLIASLDKIELTETTLEDSTGWKFALVVESDSKDIKLTFIDKDICQDNNGNNYKMKNVDDVIQAYFQR